ncbi:MAG: 50S ribosomal protein L25 [Nitrospiraceae bacterium]|nr:50S ribosomal protein L25 [Nitrospiraceae bacterium]
MERISIKAERRETSGKGVARSLRRRGVIPAVLYREGSSLPIQLDKAELGRFLHRSGGEQVIVNLAFPGGESRLALVKDYQVDPVNRELLHTDFFEVSLKEMIKVVAAIRITGEPIGVKRDGGALQYGVSQIEIECLPDSIPGHIEVDVSGLGAGHSLHVRDLSLPEGIKVLTPAEEVIASVAVPKAEEEVAPAAAAAEAAEPEVIKKGKEKEEEETKTKAEK